MLYRNRILLTEAVQWTGTNHTEIYDFAKDAVVELSPAAWSSSDTTYLVIRTPKGERTVLVGMWVLKNKFGEFSVCDDIAFQILYEAAYAIS